MLHLAIYNTHPKVVSILEDNTVFDSAGSVLVLNDALVSKELNRLQKQASAKAYIELRAKAYPPITDYLDAVVKGDTVAIKVYVDTCKAVKLKYPKV